VRKSALRGKLHRLGVEDLVVPVPGYFKDTLPRVEAAFCFSLIDCDLMESLLFCAEGVWPRLARGGRIVFDDYVSIDYAGARRGVDAFVEKHRADIAGHGLLRRLYHVIKA